MTRRPDEDPYTAMDDSLPKRHEIPEIRDTNDAAELPKTRGGGSVENRSKTPSPEPDESDEDAPRVE